MASSPDEDEVETPVPNQLVGDADLPTLRVPRLGLHDPQLVLLRPPAVNGPLGLLSRIPRAPNLDARALDAATRLQAADGAMYKARSAATLDREDSWKTFNCATSR